MLVLEQRASILGGVSIGRLLPSVRRRMVGPFIFLDHMGPTSFAIGEGIDVPPHPHIGLATVTYLFEGEIVHRDSLGYTQPIRPGAINWMTAGRGIAHSERTSPELRATGSRLHGVQVWVALPQADEECAPSFEHYPSLPELEVDGAQVRLLVGTGWNATSPVRTFSPMIYADASIRAGGLLPTPSEHRELAALIIEGTLTRGGEQFTSGQLLVFAAGATPTLRALTDARVMLLGGAPLEGKRSIWWNFVSSSKERIEQAKRDWREGRFATVVGDEEELVPLPE